LAKKKKKAAVKTSKTRLALAPVRELMKDAGADLVAKDAIMAVVEHLEATIKTVSKNALELVKLSKRKKVTGADVSKAFTM
jgi:histone H3/H4